MRIVGSVPGLERLRFVTSHPRYMSLGVVDAVADTPTACEYFHIPFQSGSNAILNAMGRGHTREKFLSIVERVRNRLPDAAITADVSFYSKRVSLCGSGVLKKLLNRLGDCRLSR